MQAFGISGAVITPVLGEWEVVGSPNLMPQCSYRATLFASLDSFLL